MTEQPKANLFEISPCNCLLVSVSLAVFLVVARLPAAVPDPGGGGPPTAHPWLDSWSFSDTNTWKSDLGFSPIGFTNLTTSLLRTEANALVVDSVNPSWLRFNVREGSGATNLNVAGSGGSALFWFSPNWCSANSTNEAGSGPGVMGRVLEVGSSASNGWFSLYFDAAGNNLYFVTQTNTGSAATNFAAPISFTSNSWHLIVWNWSVTNSALFIDGTLATNGSGTTLLPGPSVLSNGFRIGSDSTGVLQMHGAMSDLTTYSYPLDAATISSTYMLYSIFYLNPDDININVTFYPTFNAGAYNVVGGPGALTIVGTNTTTCAPTNSNIWITNTTVTVTNGTNFLLFSVAGGVPGVAYDVFATGGFLAPTNNTPWAWLGQAYECVTNKIGFTNAAIYLELGTPQDTDGDGLTDALEHLVSKTNPANAYSAGDGIPDGWKVLQGLDPLIPGLAGQDPDRDGLSNTQEYQYGTNPQVYEGFAIWVSEPLVSSGIP